MESYDEHLAYKEINDREIHGTNKLIGLAWFLGLSLVGLVAYAAFFMDSN